MNPRQSDESQQVPISDGIPIGTLRSVHHIALNVKDMKASCAFYGAILGLHQLQGDEVPATLTVLVAAGKVANFKTPDGTILDLFSEPDLLPPNENPKQQFTRANHFAFDIDPEAFDRAVDWLQENRVPIDHGPVSRPTGRGIYFYDPDGFMLEIRCDRIDEIYHIISTQDLATAQNLGKHHAASLDTEGFIHCSTKDHVLWAANKHYSGISGLQLLAIDPQKITATWRFDPVPGIGMFPHIYGELNLDAVVRSDALVADESGEFIFPFK
jgi:glyoxylase I family protein